MGNRLETTEGEAPRIVIFSLDGKEQITMAYLVADAEVKIEIYQPTVEKIIAVLFASYYVWNRQFPAAYSNLLNYLNHEFLKVPISSATIKKFIRSCDRGDGISKFLS